MLLSVHSCALPPRCVYDPMHLLAVIFPCSQAFGADVAVTDEELEKMRVKQLKQFLSARGEQCKGHTVVRVRACVLDCVIA